MARAAKLKVYRTAIGFHDAYVAAASQQAALEAWGSDRNLFARGAAEVVTDDALTAEPLASPGKVIKRLRGTVAEQLAALPPDEPAPARPAKPQPAARRAKAKAPAKRKPRPSRAALDAAERRLEALERKHVDARASLAAREAALARERRALEDEQAKARVAVERTRDEAEEAYRRALRAWQA